MQTFTMHTELLILGFPRKGFLKQNSVVALCKNRYPWTARRELPRQASPEIIIIIIVIIIITQPCSTKQTPN